MIIKTLRKTADIYPIHDIRVIDGDTIEADICLPFGQKFRARIRLKGWWADETEGPYSGPGLTARHVLHTWIGDKALWIHAPSARKDRYGRVVAHLMHGEKIINPRDVLGHLQLSEKEHKLRKDQILAGRRGPDAFAPAVAAPPPSGLQPLAGVPPDDFPDIRGIGTAEGQSNAPINDPRAFSCGRDALEAASWANQSTAPDDQYQHW